MFLILGTFCTTGIAKKKKMHVHYSKNQAIQTNTKMMGGRGITLLPTIQILTFGEKNLDISLCQVC